MEEPSEKGRIFVTRISLGVKEDEDESPPSYADLDSTTKSLSMAQIIGDIPVSLDLLKTTLYEVNFLRKIAQNGRFLYNEMYILNAIRRYEQCWLPLQAKINNLTIIPPLDVHWIWHTHMLAPQHYHKDCTSIVGAIIDHQQWSPEEMESLQDNSIKAWQSFCPSEPYDFMDSATQSESLWMNYNRKSTYDIAMAIQRQRNFVYQISLPHYTSPKFLAEAVHRYMGFLYLKSQYRNKMLTPCNDFDVVWHSHQVHPVIYSTDMVKLLGKLLTHDDSLENEELHDGEAVTKELWAKHFPNQPFYRRGAVNRPHKSNTLGIEEHPFLTSIESDGKARISRISITGKPGHRDQLKLKITATMQTPVTTIHTTSLRTVLPDNYQMDDGFSLQMRLIPRYFSVNPGHSGKVDIELDMFNQRIFKKKDLIKLRGSVPLEKCIPSLVNHDLDKSKNTLVKLSDEKIQAEVEITTTMSKIEDLELTVGKFELINSSTYPGRHLADLCRAAAVNKSQCIGDVSAWMAIHKLKNLDNSVEYTVMVIHSAEMLLSMVLVYKNARLLAVSRLMTYDETPSKDQVDENLLIPHLSAPTERAMVVMNHDGDFAAIKADWAGFQRRIPGEKGVRGKPGIPGKLLVKAFDLLEGKNRAQCFEVPSLKNATKFMVGDAQADLRSTRIKCDTAHMPEQIACIFSTAVLFVLCNPDKIRSPMDRSRIGLPCQKWPLILAAGYGENNPSTRYLIQEAACSGVDTDLPIFYGYNADMTLMTVGAACAAGGTVFVPSCSACGGCGGGGGHSSGGGGGGCGGGGCGGGGCGGGGDGGGGGCGGGGCGGGGCGGGGCGGG